MGRLFYLVIIQFLLDTMLEAIIQPSYPTIL